MSGVADRRLERYRGAIAEARPSAPAAEALSRRRLSYPFPRRERKRIRWLDPHRIDLFHRRRVIPSLRL